MCLYFRNVFVDLILKGKDLLGYAKLFAPRICGKNDEIILKYFQSLKKGKKYIALFPVSISNLENLEKTLVLSIICSKCNNDDEKIFKKAESIDYKFLV